MRKSSIKAGSAIAVLAISGGLAVSGCGSDSSDSTSTAVQGAKNAAATSSGSDSMNGQDSMKENDSMKGQDSMKDDNHSMKHADAMNGGG